MSAATDALLQATQACTEQIRRMLPMEQEKRKAIIADDPKLMEKMMCEQQAAIMQLENLEKQRIQRQQEAGFGGMSAEQIAAVAEEPDRERLSACFAELRAAAKELKTFNAKATELARASVQFWESYTTSVQHRPLRTTYGTDGTQKETLGSSSLKIQI